MMSKRDYDALMSGKQLLENNQYTTPIGRSIDLASGKWDGNKAVVALYEASNIIDTRDKEAVNDYVIESSIFLNRLNEKCHIDGYHFDMDDGESGKIYFGKDIEDNSLAYNTSEDEITYSQEAAYFTYMMNKDLCQQRVNKMIEESLVLTDNQMAISEKVDSLLILHEGVGDKVKDGWEKFKAFINKIWNKFLEFISRTINSDKNYLEKYKEIILKREYKANDVEVDGDYHTGVTRISTFQIWSPNVDEVRQLPDGDSDEELKAVQRLVMKPYAEKSNEDFKDFCLNYFKGGPDSVTMDKGRIRMENLFDYCYNFDKIRRSIEKNRGIMDKAGNAFIELAKQENAKSVQGAAGGQGSVQGAVNQDNNTGKIKVTKIDKTGDGTYRIYYTLNGQNQSRDVKSNANEGLFKQAFPINHDMDESAFENAIKSAESNNKGASSSNLTPDDRGTISATGSNGNYTVSFTPSDSTKTAPDKKTVTSPIKDLNAFNTKIKAGSNKRFAQFQSIPQIVNNGSNITESFKIQGSLGLISIHEAKVISNSGGSDNSKVKVNSTASNFGNASTGRNMVRSKTGIVDKDGTGLKGLTDDQITKRVHKYTSTASTVFATILQAAETIKKDYMQIIKLHVRSYVGETDEERREGKTTAASPHNYGQGIAVSFSDENLSGLQNEITKAGDQPDEATKNRILNMAHEAVGKNDKGVPNKTWDSYEALKAEINSLVQQQQAKQAAANANATQQGGTST